MSDACGAECPAEDAAHTRVRLATLRAEKIGLERQLNRLQARNAELERANDVRARLLEVVAHDVRSPISSIMSGLTELEKVDALAAHPRAEKVVRLMRECTQRILRLTNDLDDLAALQSGRLLLRCAPVDLAAVCQCARDVAVAHATAAGRTLEVRIDRPERPTWVRADEDRLAQALGHLVHSVALHVGKKLRLIVSSRSNGSELAIQWESDGSHEAWVQIFEAAFHAHSGRDVARAHRHVAFGLSLARGIVHAHGGEIRVESDESSSRIVIKLAAS